MEGHLNLINLNRWMQSILMAILDFLMSLFYTKKIEVKPIEPKPKSEIPLGYRALFFNCWLCDGKTKFACKKSIKKKKFTIECSRCGVENIVSITPPQN